MTPLRVLLVTASPDRGGAEAIVLQLINRLDRARVTPVAVACSGGGFVNELRATGCEVIDVGTLGRMREIGRSLAFVRRLAGAIRRERIDIVHNHGTMAHLIGGMAATLAGVPSVQHVQDLFGGALSMDSVLQRLTLRVPAAARVAASHSVRSAMIETGAPRDRVRLVNNGVSLETSAPAFQAEGPVVVWAGRLQHWKGTHVFLDAARLIADTYPDVRFWIVGGTLFEKEPAYAGQLEEQVGRLGLTGVVTFTGHVEDARPYFAAADVVVHSSIKPEPFGLVVAEAMAEGKPVVAFDEGGPSEMIESGRSGRLVAPGDTNALAAAVVDLLGRPELRARIGATAKQRARHFSAEETTRRMHEVYDEVMEGRRR